VLGGKKSVEPLLNSFWQHISMVSHVSIKIA
jgi:hypothetical protein